MSLEDLHHLAVEIRQRILSTSLKNGGHLGASLGAVELAIALHAVFESPREPLVWDVGHQAYAHKLLTGRWERFDTLRQTGGISGFLSREESEHDVFGAGHSSTALSAALAMAWARRKTRDWTVAIVGDGGLTAGIAFEALNNVRATELGPMLLLLNDNQMSISHNVGAVPAILSGGAEDARRFFELMGFDYVGPVDGHDLATLIGTLRGIREAAPSRPIVLHALTQKGKGYIPAEERPSAFHGVSPVQAKVGDRPAGPAQKSYSEVFGEALCELAASDPRIVAITAAMPEGTGLAEFARRFPDRFFDVGIAEPHAVTFAAGLATQGLRPVVAIYSTFLQRGIDQLIHDVVLQKLPVVFAIDRAGIVGADGPTHHGVFDLAYLGMVPGLTVAAPSGLGDIKTLLAQALAAPGPWAIRYPRGSGPRDLQPAPRDGLRAHQIAENPELIVAALGAAASRALLALQSLAPEARGRVSVYSSLFAKPIPEALLSALAANPEARVLTVEDGVSRGGFGEAVLAAVSGRGEIAGYADRFIPHGSPAALEDSEGVSGAALAKRMSRLLS